MKHTLIHTHTNIFGLSDCQLQGWLSLYVGMVVIDRSDCDFMSDWLSLYVEMVVNHKNGCLYMSKWLSVIV